LASVLFLVSAGLAVVVRLPMLEQAASDATARVMASSLIMVVDSNARLGSGGVETAHAAGVLRQRAAGRKVGASGRAKQAGG
jgi:hypothetical protein